MTIDISNLSQEEQAFLKANPDLLKSIEEAIPKELERTEKRKEKLLKTMSVHQQKMAELQDKFDFRLFLDPTLKDIQQKFDSAVPTRQVSTEEIMCPVCGSDDKGNKVNGKPWCLKCNVMLLPKHKIKRWKPIIRQVNEHRATLLDLNSGLYPKEDE